MKTPALTDAMAKVDAPISRARPEVAADLLQRLNHALNVRDNVPEESRRFADSEGYPADTDVDTRIHDEPAFGTFVGIKSAGTSNAPASERATQPTLADELLTMLDQLSARVYVGEQRVLLTLESALPGAAAEIVREGAHLIIRLHASNETAFRTLLTQRDALERTLKEHNLPHVAVEMMPIGGVAHERRD